jgi:hypothetical protein
VRELDAALRRSIRSGGANMRRLNSNIPTYVVRAGSDLRVEFEVRDEAIFLKTAFYKSDNHRYSA